MEKRKINIDKDEKHWLSVSFFSNIGFYVKYLRYFFIIKFNNALLIQMIPVVVVLVSLFSYAVITSKNTRQSQKTDYETYENFLKIDEKKCYSSCS